MGTHSSILAWSIPWTEEPGRLQSTRVARVGHDLVTKPPGLVPTPGPKEGPQIRLQSPPCRTLCPGTRVLVQLSPQLRGRVAGLCGDFDGDASNDLRSRQGVLEPTAELAAHSWRLRPLCPEPGDLPHPCAVRMGRRGGEGRRGQLLEPGVGGGSRGGVLRRGLAGPRGCPHR